MTIIDWHPVRRLGIPADCVPILISAAQLAATAAFVAIMIAASIAWGA